jgi:hypothetical protein
MIKKVILVISAVLIIFGFFLILDVNVHKTNSTNSKDISSQLKYINMDENAKRKTIVSAMTRPSEIQSDNNNIAGLTNSHPIEGYTDKISYFPGQTIQFKVHAPLFLFSIKLIRYGEAEEMERNIANVSGFPQNYPQNAYQIGANWKTSYQFTIPENWRSGLYAAELSDSKSKFYVTFLIKSRYPQSKDIAVLSSTNTWQAYNDWGGKSLYSYHKVKNKAVYQEIVSFQRPNPGADPNGNVGHLANGERHILGWLESKGYHYNMLADVDLNNDPKVLDPYKVLIISTHSEYWTLEMYNNLKAYLNRGGTVLYLSGNGMCWRAAIKNDQIEVMKNGGFHSLTKGIGGHFFNLGLPESKILGVRYKSTGFSNPSPYTVVTPNHWIFSHTGLKKGDLIGEKGLNTVKNSLGGASGWETDQMDKYSPKNIILLAKGTNKFQKGADMTYYDHPGGGGVFSVGSITFGGSLAIDKQLSQMVQNVINRFNR